MTRQIIENVEVQGTFKATGAVDLDSTLNVDGVTTHVGDVIASIIRRATEDSLLRLMGGTSITQGPYISLRGKDAGGSDDGNVQFVSTTESSAVGDHESYIYDGATANLFAAIRAATWRHELSHPAVAHGMTAAVPTNVFGAFYPTSLTAGGLTVLGLSDIDARALVLAGLSGGATPTVSPVLFYAAKKSGTSSQALAATEPAFVWQNFSTILATMLGSGSFGLGTENPIQQVEIYGPSGGIALTRNSDTVGSEPFVLLRKGVTPSSLAQIRGIHGGGIRFTDGAVSVEWARFSATGDYGIGLSTLLAKLHVLQATLGNAVFQMQSTASNDDSIEIVYQNKVTTTDATVTTIHTFTIPASTTYMIEAAVVARRTGGSAGAAEDGAGFKFIGVYKNVAGVATEINQTNIFSGNPFTWSAVFDVTGATARCRVTGAVNNNISWTMTARVWPIST